MTVYHAQAGSIPVIRATLKEIIMKVYWVVAYDQHYPLGGLRNVQGTFDTREEAEAYAKTLQGYDYVQVENVSYRLGIE